MIRLALGLWLALAGAASADACAPITHLDRAFTLCTADLAIHDVALRLNGADGRPLGSFSALDTATAAPIVFAMNGGMYHQDRRPVGLYVEDGIETKRIVTAAGPGNFGMLPNGVFCVDRARAAVLESRAFARRPAPCTHATQSGPMLVIDGDLHPRFFADSPYRNIRNGVGVAGDGRRVHAVISDEPVTFHEIATLFRDRLGVPDALYLDGRVSRLYAPGQGRVDPGRRMGPILVVTERQDG